MLHTGALPTLQLSLHRACSPTMQTKTMQKRFHFQMASGKTYSESSDAPLMHSSDREGLTGSIIPSGRWIRLCLPSLVGQCATARTHYWASPARLHATLGCRGFGKESCLENKNLSWDGRRKWTKSTGRLNVVLHNKLRTPDAGKFYLFELSRTKPIKRET